MEDKVLFSTAFNGFNKQDVLNYIENLVDEYENKLKTIKEELKGAKTALEGKTHLYEDLLKKQQELGAPEELVGKIEEINSTISQYQQKYNQIQNDYSEMQQKYDQMQIDYSQIEKKYQQKQIDYSQMEQKYNALLLKGQEANVVKEQPTDQLNRKIAQMEEELSEYRSQKQNIGSVLLRAQKDADELIFNTKKKCDQEVLKAQKYINDVRKLFEKYNDQVKVEKEQILHSTSKINNDLDNIFDYIENAHNTFEDIVGFLKTPETLDNE